MTDDELIAELRKRLAARRLLVARARGRALRGRRRRAAQVSHATDRGRRPRRPRSSGRLRSDSAATRSVAASTASTRHADGAVITDYKSSDVSDQKRADAKARDSLQLQVYALAHKAQTGGLPQRVQLHFVESGVVGSASPVTRSASNKARDKLPTRPKRSAARKLRAQAVGHRLRLLPVPDDLQRERRVISVPEQSRPPHQHAAVRSGGALRGRRVGVRADHRRSAQRKLGRGRGRRASRHGRCADRSLRCCGSPRSYGPGALRIAATGCAPAVAPRCAAWS